MEKTQERNSGSNSPETPAGDLRECCCASPDRIRLRTPEEKKALITRLNRAEGQIRGIRNMVENDAYCIDIITQVSAAASALNSFSRELLSTHIRTCVAEDVRDGKDEKLEEVIRTLQKLMK